MLNHCCANAVLVLLCLVCDCYVNVVFLLWYWYAIAIIANDVVAFCAMLCVLLFVKLLFFLIAVYLLRDWYAIDMSLLGSWVLTCYCSIC